MLYISNFNRDFRSSSALSGSSDGRPVTGEKDISSFKKDQNFNST